MTDQITQEQAVQIAEFLGVEERPEVGWSLSGSLWLDDKPLLDNEGDRIDMVGFIPWLYSPEGQSAVMDRLWAVEAGVWTEPDFSLEADLKTKIKKVYVMVSWGDNEFEGIAPTRQHALLLAVLSMLKGGE